MPNYSKLYYSAAEYKIFLSVANGTTAPLLTVSDFEDNEKIESEPQHVVGEIDPVAIKVNGRTFTGKLTAAAGEMEILLQANGLSKYTDIQNANIIVSSFDGIIVKRIIGVFINSKSLPIKAKDKSTLISLDYEYLDVQ
jgi:hypothetical protein